MDMYKAPATASVVAELGAKHPYRKTKYKRTAQTERFPYLHKWSL